MYISSGHSFSITLYLKIAIKECIIKHPMYQAPKNSIRFLVFARMNVCPISEASLSHNTLYMQISRIPYFPVCQKKDGRKKARHRTDFEAD